MKSGVVLTLLLCVTVRHGTVVGQPVALGEIYGVIERMQAKAAEVELLPGVDGPVLGGVIAVAEPPQTFHLDAASPSSACRRAAISFVYGKRTATWT